MGSVCEDPKRKKQFGRYPAKPPVGEVHRDGHLVRFTAQNGESYQVDVSKMQQRNLRTGKERAVSFQGATGWFFDRNNARPVRWLPYARSLHRVLDAAFEATDHKKHVPDVPKRSEQNVENASSEVTPPQCQEETFDPRAVCRDSLGRDNAASVIQTVLESHPSLEFSIHEARAAALSGQVEALRIVLCRGPQVQLTGQDIFDRRYPGFVLTARHKCCIKIMLARGARLGKFAPSSKLLRKVESDMLGLWVDRFLHSLLLAGVDLPDPVQESIVQFIAA